MKQLQISFIFIFSFFIFSCEEEKNEVSTPNIIFESPLVESFLIGEDINISIFVNHDEVIDTLVLDNKVSRVFVFVPFLN